MRILRFEDLKKEMESCAAFNVAFLRAIDPRLITHRPRDPEKARLMDELGMEPAVSESPDSGQECDVEVEGNTAKKKSRRKGIIPDFSVWKGLPGDDA